MLLIIEKETVLRNSADKAYAIDIELRAFKGPLTMKTIQMQNTPDGDTTDDVEVPDLDKSTKLGSVVLQWLIPTDKQTDTFPTAPRVTNTEYDSLIWQWRELYREDGDYKRLDSELRESYKSHDGKAS